MKPPYRPRDFSQRALQIVGELTGQLPKQEPGPPKNPHAQALGQLGGLKGGRVRADRLSPERRREIAKKAAAARWKRA